MKTACPFAAGFVTCLAMLSIACGGGGSPEAAEPGAEPGTYANPFDSITARDEIDYWSQPARARIVLTADGRRLVDINAGEFAPGTTTADEVEE